MIIASAAVLRIRFGVDAVVTANDVVIVTCFHTTEFFSDIAGSIDTIETCGVIFWACPYGVIDEFRKIVESADAFIRIGFCFEIDAWIDESTDVSDVGGGIGVEVKEVLIMLTLCEVQRTCWAEINVAFGDTALACFIVLDGIFITFERGQLEIDIALFVGLYVGRAWGDGVVVYVRIIERIVPGAAL